MRVLTGAISVWYLSFLVLLLVQSSNITIKSETALSRKLSSKCLSSCCKLLSFYIEPAMHMEVWCVTINLLHPPSSTRSKLASDVGNWFIADLSGSNVAFTSTRLSNLTEKKLFNIIEAPSEPEELARLDGKPLDKGQPSHLIEAVSWDNEIDEDDEDLRIIDLGEAFIQGAEPTRLAQHGPLRVPETILTKKFDYRIDLWRAGVMVGLQPLEPPKRYFYVDTYIGSFTHSYLERFLSYTQETPISWLRKWLTLWRHCQICGGTFQNQCEKSLNGNGNTWQLSLVFNALLFFPKIREPIRPGMQDATSSLIAWRRISDRLDSLEKNLPPLCKLKQKFDEKVHEDTLKPLLPVIKGLMRFRPEEWISASQALELLK